MNSLDFYNKPSLRIELDKRLLHAPTNRGNKGTGFIFKAVNSLIDEGFNLKLDLAENINHVELKKTCRMGGFIGQILGSWYKTVDIEAIAIGRKSRAFTERIYDIEKITETLIKEYNK